MITEELLKKFIEKKLTLSSAESCTGGLVASMITDLSGSSQIFMGSVVAYSNDIKVRVLGVHEETLKNVGAVSIETAKEMAEGVRSLMKTDFAIATTGIAGPLGGSPEKPVGTVAIAIAGPNQTISKLFQFKGDRTTLKKEFAHQAFQLLMAELHS